jgi:uncharacterized protein (DUF1501 family)
MKRIDFIKQASLTALFPFALNTLSSCSRFSSGLQQNKIIVFIQLVGGNDGLNTLIPLTSFQQLRKARPNLVIPENKILPLKGTLAAGLHPAMKEIKEMYDNKLVGFVQGVGYENQNYSHFRSSDIWLTGSKASQVFYTGWMARYLETIYQGYPVGFPGKTNSDPPAIKIGDTGTYLFQGTSMDMSIVIDPSTSFEKIDVDEEAGETETLAGKEVQSIREILLQTNKYTSVIKKALSVSITHASGYPKQGENPLADQLKVVAKLIKGGLQTPVYLVDMKGFDTHDAQAEIKDSTKGVHAELLTQLSRAISCFWEDINSMGRENDVLGITFSEFGRRIMANGGNGTDHGTSQPVMYFGKNIVPGITGENPPIPELITANDNLSLQFDFRSIFSSVLKQWYGCSQDKLSQVFYDEFPEIKIFKHSL